MIKIAIEIFVLYLLYKIIFDFVIPVAKTTKQVKKQFNEMNSRMQDAMNRQQQPNNNFSQSTTEKKRENKDDYIDFEEIK